MSKSSGQVKETEAQRAMAQVGAQQVASWKKRWAPRLTAFAADTEKAGLADSAERRHATALAGTDASAQFGLANQKALVAASNNGTVGSSRQKLALTGMANDQATSTAFGSVSADQAVDDSTVQGLQAVTSIARGEKADTINAMGRNAAISGQQAAADAQQSLDARIGEAGLATKIIGTSAGMWYDQQKEDERDLRSGVRGQRGYG